MEKQQEERLALIYDKISKLVEDNQLEKIALSNAKLKLAEVQNELVETRKMKATLEAELSVQHLSESVNSAIIQEQSDTSGLKLRINEFIKDIDRCIAQLDQQA